MGLNPNPLYSQMSAQQAAGSRMETIGWKIMVTTPQCLNNKFEGKTIHDCMRWAEENFPDDQVIGRILLEPKWGFISSASSGSESPPSDCASTDENRQ